ncbi:hypothetical protein R0J87_15540 [Halomonas sp. SIMBA_159]
MTDIDQLFVRRPRAIRVSPFTAEKADYVMQSDGRKPIYFIHTREGRRHISEDILIAEKSDSYRHPMDAKVLQREYVSLLAYDSAFVVELKSQLAEQLREIAHGNDPVAAILALANALSGKDTRGSIHAEHEECV